MVIREKRFLRMTGRFFIGARNHNRDRSARFSVGINSLPTSTGIARIPTRPSSFGRLTRVSLSPGRWSHLLEEFTQMFAIDQAFDPAAAAFERIFRQRLSVDTL